MGGCIWAHDSSGGQGLGGSFGQLVGDGSTLFFQELLVAREDVLGLALALEHEPQMGAVSAECLGVTADARE